MPSMGAHSITQKSRLAQQPSRLVRAIIDDWQAP
jgi:hypothetical protein